MDKPHKKLDARREAFDLTIVIYHATDDFLKELRFALTDQIHPAALSIASNIAEGTARQTRKEFAHYLDITQASLSGLDTQHQVAKRLKVLRDNQRCTLDAQLNHLVKLLSRLIRYLKSGKSQQKSPYPSPLTVKPCAVQ
jgi:four helix bundle protein